MYRLVLVWFFACCISQFSFAQVAPNNHGTQSDLSIDRQISELEAETQALENRLKKLAQEKCMRGPENFKSWVLRANIPREDMPIFLLVDHHFDIPGYGLTVMELPNVDLSPTSNERLGRPLRLTFPRDMGHRGGYAVLVSSNQIPERKFSTMLARVAGNSVIMDLMLPRRYYSAFRENHGRFTIKVIGSNDPENKVLHSIVLETDGLMEALSRGKLMSDEIIRDIASGRCGR